MHCHHLCSFLFAAVYTSSLFVVPFQRNDTAQESYQKLQEAGYSAEVICRDTPLDSRDKAFRRFVLGESRVMLATDTVSRSLDVPETRIVVHFDIPFDGNRMNPSCKLFLNRSTRAGRFGRNGIVLTMLESKEMYDAYKRIGEYFQFGFKPIHH